MCVTDSLYQCICACQCLYVIICVYFFDNVFIKQRHKKHKKKNFYIYVFNTIVLKVFIFKHVCVSVSECLTLCE